MDRLIKSIFWLIIGTGTGYGLYATLTPSEERIAKLRKEISGSDNRTADDRSKNQKFLDILQASAKSNKPIYLMSKEELAQLHKKAE